MPRWLDLVVPKKSVAQSKGRCASMPKVARAVSRGIRLTRPAVDAGERGESLAQTYLGSPVLRAG